MRKIISMCAVCILGSTLMVAQADQPTTATKDGKTVVANVPRDVAPRRDNNVGWIGLLGLAGLAGLLRRERHDAVTQDHGRRDIRRDAEIRRVG